MRPPHSLGTSMQGWAGAKIHFNKQIVLLTEDTKTSVKGLERTTTKQ